MSERNADGVKSWREILLVYTRPRMLSMLLLGFSGGLPFFLIFGTLSAWLRQEGVQRSTIGMLAWAGMAYTVKFLWSPVVDRVPVPFLTRALGRRRSWLLVAQVGVALGLVNQSLSNPAADIFHVAFWAVFIAFCAATQDIALDAWRIESSPVEEQGVMLSAYQLGYRSAMLTSSAGLLLIAGEYGWHTGYMVMAVLTLVGIVTTLCSREPQAAVDRASLLREEHVVQWLHARAHWPRPLQHAGAWLFGAVVSPLVEYFARYGAGLAAVILLFVCGYRLTDFTMGTMTNSFYIDRGYTLSEIGTVVKAWGLGATIVGILAAGAIIVRIGLLRSLILGSLLVIFSNLGFSLLARAGDPGLLALGMVNGFDNLAQAIHGTALLTFLSSLTSVRYTATQYALFSSLYALPSKVLEGFSGFIAERLGYADFFLYTASLSLPSLLVLLFLVRRGKFQPGAAHA